MIYFWEKDIEKKWNKITRKKLYHIVFCKKYLYSCQKIYKKQFVVYTSLFRVYSKCSRLKLTNCIDIFDKLFWNKYYVHCESIYFLSRDIKNEVI